MNLRNLAKLADVSVSTVSKAFSGSNDISNETRERIFEVAKQYGCYDKYNKNKFDKKVIAVICPEVRGDYYNNYLTLLKHEIETNNGVMIVGIYDFSTEKMKELFSYYSCYCNVDGIIVLGSADNLVNIVNVPAVNIGASSNNRDIITVNVVMSGAVDAAIKHLKNCGHEKIGYAGEILTSSKLASFKESLRNNGLPVISDYIKTSDFRFEQAGEDYFNSILSKDDRPTAVVAAYDNIAIGIIKMAKKHNMKIPSDLSIISFDNIGVSSYIDPPLSTISDRACDVSKKAVELILRKIDDPLFHCDAVQIESELLDRESVFNLHK